MPSLPTDTFAAAEFLVRCMYRPIEPEDGKSLFAVAETALPIDGDSWFWTDDNAKVLEFLSRPELQRRFPRETAEILRFVHAMCRGPLIFRRVSPPRLEPVEMRDGLGVFRHSLMSVKYDLSRGAVLAGLRFHDDRNSDHLLLTGNRVEFTYRGRHFRLAVEPAISDTRVTPDGHTLRLCHSSELYFKSRGTQLRLGRITYAYTIDARSMFIEVEVTLDIEPGLHASDVVLTVGHEQPGRMYYRTIVTDSASAPQPLFHAGIPGRRRHNLAGASYYLIRQPDISGDCVAIHSSSRTPERLSGIETTVRSWGWLGRTVACYSFPGSQSGARLAVGERKLLTGGGFYDRIADYAALIRDAAPPTTSTRQAVWDFSTSYDYGSKINAFAKCYSVSRHFDTTIDRSPFDCRELQSLFEIYLNYYFTLFVNGHEAAPNSIFSRDLSFVILAVVTMYRITKAASYLERLKRLCDVLLMFEVRFRNAAGRPASGFLMRMDSPRAAFVDCHSAALLALTQTVRYLDDPRLVAAIERGLANYFVDTGSGVVGRPEASETIATSMVDWRGIRRTENAFWNFKAGMTLRFFAALRQSPNALLRSIAHRHRERMDLLEAILRRQIEKSITLRPDGIEIRTAVTAGETNSETQPWVMLGLFGHPAD